MSAGFSTYTLFTILSKSLKRHGKLHNNVADHVGLSVTSRFVVDTDRK